MRVSSWFVTRAHAVPEATSHAVGRTPQSPQLAQQAVGAFITPQSLVTFPVASGLVALIWAVFRQLFPWGASTAVPAVTALLLGVGIFLITVSEPQARPRGVAGWVVAIFIGLANTFVLLAAALGVSPAGGS